MTSGLTLPELPSYQYPSGVAIAFVRDVLLGRGRSFGRDARKLAAGISQVRVLGKVPHFRSGESTAGRDTQVQPGSSRGLLLTFNHFARPGFRVWWLPIAIAASMQEEVRWVMAAGWTYPDPVRRHTLEPLTQWLFARIARTYGFVSMPPMPPRPWEITRRALAVRRVLDWARTTPRPLIGLAPEGMDPPPGKLMMPPPGVGRFIERLARQGLAIVPIAGYEEGDALCLRFGEPYSLPRRLPAERQALDREVAGIVIRAIAEYLPEHLRVFAETQGVQAAAGV
jgi:hypothetical protein